jgi:hypothetical protein
MVNPLVFQIFSATSPALHPIASATESVTPPATAAGQLGQNLSAEIPTSR